MMVHVEMHRLSRHSPVEAPVMIDNPQDANSGRVARGGSSHAVAWWTRSTTRAWDFPATPANPKGFTHRDQWRFENGGARDRLLARLV